MSSLEVEVAGSKTWAAEHDGRINAYWDAQFRENKQCAKEMQSQSERITRLEGKLMYIAGLAAAGGGLLGNLVNF